MYPGQVISFISRCMASILSSWIVCRTPWSCSRGDPGCILIESEVQWPNCERFTSSMIYPLLLMQSLKNGMGLQCWIKTLWCRMEVASQIDEKILWQKTFWCVRSGSDKQSAPIAQGPSQEPGGISTLYQEVNLKHFVPHISTESTSCFFCLSMNL